ncbi:hypothetical protein A7E78_05630 [Syntrophotalea acetylenivorans]|uniref:Flagellar hook-length control protein-like C-terminal domain-containing protein n=1 Tax=Syntrophotalea acetylenivorans TaxID=1842532 RepID=A0A1L3GNW7_9BACT|nr:hypothetical protein [Syntrophotalea acetylenivorans]APG27368.1 hypothetical protein A7E78_05630 [Syntrophotalea acetylenivorans]
MSIINPLITIRPVMTPAQAATPAEGRQYDLQAGQLVNATVAEGGHSEVLLDLDRQRLRAQTQTPLQTGQKLRLLVVENKPQLVLRLFQDNLLERLTHTVHLLEGKYELSSALQQLTSSQGTGKNLPEKVLQKLLDFFSPFRTESPEALSGKELQLLARHLGLTLEADLARGPSAVEPANLKSLLLSTVQTGGEQQPETVEKAEQLLQKLELFQLCNLRLARQGANLLPLPLPFLDNGYLVAEKETGNAPEQQTARKVSLYLSLQGLGDLRIDLLQEAEGLFVRFTCDSGDKTEFLSAQESELRSMLTTLPLCGATYCSDKGPLQTDLIRRILEDEDELFDARI